MENYFTIPRMNCPSPLVWHFYLDFPPFILNLAHFFLFFFSLVPIDFRSNQIFLSDRGCCSFCLFLIVLYSPPSKFLFITLEMTTTLMMECDPGHCSDPCIKFISLPRDPGLMGLRPASCHDVTMSRWLTRPGHSQCAQTPDGRYRVRGDARYNGR